MQDKNIGNPLIYKIVGALFVFFIFFIGFSFLSGIYWSQAQEVDEVRFSVEQGESVRVLAERLKEENIIKSPFFFRLYLKFKGLDRKVQAGEYTVEAPITTARVVRAFEDPLQKGEFEITIIPGWDLRNIAAYFEDEGIATQKEFYGLVGEPAVEKNNQQVFNQLLVEGFDVLKNKPTGVSLEGYMSPDTFRFFEGTSIEDIIIRLVQHRDSQFTDEMYSDIKKSGRSLHQIMTMASLLEREVRSKSDKAKVADLFWRRFDENWALQADSTVHYATGKTGNVFTSKEDRDSLNPWNTYKYPGLPPGPIATPSLESIVAAIYPEPNTYNYFLTTFDGVVKYAEDLEGHNRNVQRYLR